MLRIEDAFSLSEAGSQCISYRRQSPGCGRYAPLARGYGKFSLSEAVAPGRSAPGSLLPSADNRASIRATFSSVAAEGSGPSG